MNIQTKLNNESYTVSGELYDLWIISGKLFKYYKSIMWNNSLKLYHEADHLFLDEVFQGQEKTPSLFRWIIHSWHSWWDSGFLTLNSVIFSLHQTPCPCDYDPEGRKDMNVEAESLLPFVSDSLLFGSLGISVLTAMWKWTSKMYGFLMCENIIFGIPSSFSQATVDPQFLEWWVILWLLVISSHKSCKWDHGYF